MEEPILNSHNKEEYPPMHTAEHILNGTMVKMFGWNTFGVLLMGPAVATGRFFSTLNKIEDRLNHNNTKSQEL